MKRIFALALALAVASAFTAGATTATAAQPITAPVTGSLPGGGTFAGTLSLQQFTNQNGVLTAVGTLSGTLTDATGAVIGTVTNVPVSLPISQATGTCQILHLELGPLDLNLLGLMIHLDQTHLTIKADSEGGLLGSLLCGLTDSLVPFNLTLADITQLADRAQALNADGSISPSDEDLLRTLLNQLVR
jgi:hypothetical protein